MRMMSPFQQVNSSPSEHQRRFERMTMILPVGPARAPARVALQQEGVTPHDPVDPLPVGQRLTILREFPVHECRDPAIALGRPLVDEAADQRQ